MDSAVASPHVSNALTPPAAPIGVAGGVADYRPSAPARMLALAAGVGVLLSALFALYLGLLGSGHTPWFIVGFEAVTILAAVFAMLVGLGRFDSAPGMALVCAAGAIGAGTYMAHLGSGREVLPMWFLGARAILTGALLLAAVLAVLARNQPAATRSLVRSGMFALPLGVILAGGFVMRHQIGTLPGGVKLIGGFFVFLLVTGLVAGAVHGVIRAFEVCDEDPALR
jgi:hypothetical protein